jgi:DNA-binding CsgD family transcriptional regulator
MKTDPKTVQTLLRHSDVKLTIQSYSHAMREVRLRAAGDNADWERTKEDTIGA